jgi:thiamine biosynthesis lipoprotein
MGYAKLRIFEDGKAEMDGGMRVDLSGIGKGYAVDRVREMFHAVGVASALVNFGGSSIYASGAPPGRSGWQIAIRDTQENIRGSIILRDRALSTSGTMGHYWTVGGTRYGHLIDPKIGRPVTEPRLATVVARSATAAEALSKPVAIRGREALPVVGAVAGADA